jgi:membrane protein required for colicin V production
MNGLDYFILALITLGGAYGAVRGGLRQATSIVSLLLAVFIASMYYAEAGQIAQSQLGVSPKVGAAIGYVALFAAVFVAVEIGGSVLSTVLHTVHLGWADRLVGAVIGAGVCAALAGLIVIVLMALLPADAELLKNSELAPSALAYNRLVLSYVPDELKREYEKKRDELRRAWLERAGRGLLGPEPSPSPSPSGAKK